MAQAYALLLALGLVSVASVDAMRFDCRSRPNYLVDDIGHILTDDFGNGLTDGTRTRECRLVVGDARLPWPAWGAPVLTDE